MIFFRRILAILLTLSLLLSAVGCVELDENGNPISASSASSSQPTESVSQRFTAYLDEIFAEIAGDNLLDSRFLVRYPENFGITDIPKTMGSFDFEEMDNAQTIWQEDYDELLAFDRSQLTDEQQLIYDLLLQDAQDLKTVIDLQYYGEINSPTLGMQSNVPNILAEFRFYTVQDAYDYLEMVESATDFFADMVEYQNRRSAQGLFMTDAVADATIEACKKIIENPEKTPLLANFEDKISKLPEITAQQQEELAAKNREAVKNSLIPAYKSLIACLEQLKGSGKNEGGLCNLPDGKRYYEYKVKDATGSSRSVEDVALLLERALWNVNKEIIQMIMADETIMDRMQDPKLIPYTQPEEMIDHLREETKGRFPELTHLEYQIKYVDPSMEDNSSPAFFFLPQVDAPSENPIYINGKYTREGSQSIFSTMAHEGYPGHMYQSNYFAQTNPHPIRKLLNYSGYDEGWATYVEYLSYEMSDASDEQAAHMMRLNDQLGILVGSRIDIGIHYQGWDLEDCGDFMESFGLYRNASEFYYDLAIEDPANYLSYCVGGLEFFILRQNAQEALGSSFDEMAFHKTLLDIGPAPFAFVEKAVDDYIVANGGGETSSQAPSAAAA